MRLKHGIATLNTSCYTLVRVCCPCGVVGRSFMTYEQSYRFNKFSTDGVYLFSVYNIFDGLKYMMLIFLR